MKKIIALDLDGTTLNKQSLITERTKEVLHLAQEAGHSIILATGRPYPCLLYTSPSPRDA